MSAILGIYSPQGLPFDSRVPGRMTDILAHRGRDGSKLWKDRAVVLGHRMLRTTPESYLEQLPLQSKDCTLVITADVRLDNRAELIHKLSLKDQPLEQTTDSHLILTAYQKWSSRCPEELLGDFAFAIWDQDRQRLFCARDHFGVKPFYYYYSNGVFIFASEIKALFCDPRVPRRLNETRVGDHLALLSSDPEITFYQDIRRLPPRQSMTVSRKGIQLRSYWSLDPDCEIKLGSDEQYAEALREIFHQAVRCRLRSALPIGSLLSGGLDSSSITCMARKALTESGRPKLITFSAVFDKVTECDEREFIQAVLAQDGLDASYVHADRFSPLTDLDAILWHQDQAVAAGNLYINWCLYRAAHSRGVRVLLDGFDGDTALSHGTGYLIELARAKRWLTLAREVKAYSEKLETPWFGAWWAWVRQYGIKPKIAQSSILRLARAAKRLVAGQESLTTSQPSAGDGWSSFLNPRFVDRIGLAERRQHAKSSPALSERECHYRLLTWAMVPDTLEALDKGAAAFAIEPRFPFWDKRIVEFCLALPPEQKMRLGWTRMIMRRAMNGILPQTVQWRGGKSNLAPSLDRGLVNFERSRLDQLRLGNFCILDKFVNVSSLNQAYSKFLAGTASEVEALAVWRSLSLALWLKQSGLADSSRNGS